MKTENPKNKIAKTYPLDLGALEFERALCLDKHNLSEEGGDQEILACPASLKINGVPVSTEQFVSIDKADIHKLYKDSSSLRIHTNDILGLRVILGANIDNTMHLFFQPVGLILKNEIIDAELQNYGTFDIEKSGQVYDYINSSFQVAQATDYVNYYQTKMMINYSQSDGWSGFTSGRDVESVTFSFQEIFSFMNTTQSSVLNIFNCIRQFDTIGKGIIRKHSVVLAEEGPEPPENPVINILNFLESTDAFRGRYSNLTHLCPPNCSRLVYALERINY